jgi:hypothetical protein
MTQALTLRNATLCLKLGKSRASPEPVNVFAALLAITWQSEILEKNCTPKDERTKLKPCVLWQQRLARSMIGGVSVTCSALPLCRSAALPCWCCVEVNCLGRFVFG